MKTVFVGALLFYVIVCAGCGAKKTKQDGKAEPIKEATEEATKREFPEECKALEFINASMKIYTDCSVLLFIRVYQGKLPVSEGNEACENSFLKNMEPVENLKNQGKISSEFMTNVEEKMGEAGKVDEGICSPPAEADSSPMLVVEWFKGLPECMNKSWHQIYLELKSQYSCN